MDARARAESITHQLSESLAGSGVVVDDVVVQQAGRRRLVRVLVARDLADLDADDTTSPVEPLTLDEVAEATRTVSDTLDSSDVMGEAAYTLEVSSTGLDRPLTGRDHFRRNVGRLLEVQREDGSTVTGRLASAGTDGIRLTAANDQDLAWSEVTRATVQVEFSRPDRKDD